MVVAFFPLRNRLSAQTWRFLLVAAFIPLWILSESLQEDFPKDFWTTPESHLRLASNEVTKLLFALAIYLARRKYGHSPLISPQGTFRDDYSENQPLNDLRLSPEDGHEFPSARSSRIGWLQHARPSSISLRVGTVRSTLSILAIATLYTFRAFAVSRSKETADPLSIYLVIPAASLCSLFILRCFFSRSFSPSIWHAALLQFSGLFIIRDDLVSSTIIPRYSILCATALSTSLCLTAIDVVYKHHHPSSFDTINLILFASCAVIQLSLYLLQSLFIAPTAPADIVMMLASSSFVLPLLEATRDVVVLLIISSYDAVTESTLAAFAAMLIIMVPATNSMDLPSNLMVGGLIAIIAAVTYGYTLVKSSEDDTESETQPRRVILGTLALVLALVYISITLVHEGTGVTGPAFPFGFQVGPKPQTCHRKSLASHSFIEGPRNYTKFDDILLIVFFSHARYNANLDFHREVYADYFPNIVYIGPASREDAGFAHSYDVLVDSYESDEDLSDPSFYKMAGRMAHHMLYTALREHDCYDGYLWAPFDTLLNIPRLEQFNQDKFWYHSPWAEPVPNPAIEEHVSVRNASLHAPAALLSPDPSLNLTDGWRGWGLDWWWGDPHVGVSVCMEAFWKVPSERRERLALLTDGETRLIGGSADTLYIPGRHRNQFMDTLGLFLETECFLEIATPTALHLVVPPDDHILYVDHWWIWQPPFNASFVRQQWKAGFEVDTFHTFHWGDRDPVDGEWRSNHEHIADVRSLLRESAERQGIEFPVRDFLVPDSR
ncbi:hypothetical protein BJ138DRAFT_1146234 [Hygrophoropsis aurantiaca]|uniref:Uncharacterized protein n=1 Tax=Hygrophoropsis aurantiaca TaxID=72124 RepID=A0ACB8AII4_9AGAM|nr:hypothetical protein BJ138DRAFT_1146234 [Hygrophoropsis aurantiaca]